jgi:hypothetical protein
VSDIPTLSEAAAFKLDPSKKYLLIFDKKTIRREDVIKIGEILKREGVWSMSIILHGDPKSVQIIEDNRKATEERPEGYCKDCLNGTHPPEARQK